MNCVLNPGFIMSSCVLQAYCMTRQSPLHRLSPIFMEALKPGGTNRTDRKPAPASASALLGPRRMPSSCGCLNSGTLQKKACQQTLSAGPVRMYETKSVKTRFIVSVASNVMRGAIGFFTGLLIARGLSPAGYGDFTFLLGSF